MSRVLENRKKRAHWIRFLVLGIVVILFLPFITGCLNGHTLDEFGYVLCIGVDKGEKLPYSVTLILQKDYEGEETQKSSGYVFSMAESNNLLEAVDTIESGMPYRISMTRAILIAFSDEVASSGAMYDFLNFAEGELYLRPNADLLVVQGKAVDFLVGLNSDIDPAISKLQFNFAQYSSQTGYVPKANFALYHEAMGGKHFDLVLPLGGYDDDVKSDSQMQEIQKKGEKFSDELMQDETDQQGQGEQNQEQSEQMQPDEQGQETLAEVVSSGQEEQAQSTPTPESKNTMDSVGEENYYDIPSDLLRQGGLKSALMGCALFSNDKMVGILDGQHTQVLLMGTGEFERGRMFLEDPNGEMMSVLLSSEDKPEIEMTIEDTPHARVNIHLRGEIELPQTIHDASVDQMQDYIEAYLQQELSAVFAACQRLNADSFGFGKYAIKQFQTIKDWEAYPWEDAYEHLTVDFQVNVKLKYNPIASHFE